MIQKLINKIINWIREQKTEYGKCLEYKKCKKYEENGEICNLNKENNSAFMSYYPKCFKRKTK